MGHTAPYSHRHSFLLADERDVNDLVQCVHCGAHWIWVKGSGRKRGWCSSCGGYFCGEKCAPRGVKCIPFEKRLELCERLGDPDILDPWKDDRFQF